MDICDKANDYADHLNRNALANQLAKGRSPVGDSFTECVDCGEPIPIKRRQAMPGCVRCVSCEARHEKVGM
ncbi:TraR/DksA family transcriptional regulator [Desulfoluna spongiiphila]|uniref:Transcriptional regulator, TraR/DksA family n=1 Tax=Desulfoluna spongiiphila TaxID=419481 RepID=A0A1G5I5U9_9BACT|nr:TraR/DksA family transcriptional regulator [Desulfoluna spongiiphila]SCY71080.1 transcriptional regulator, TraR/DksA family [Desulfoluna spongiiphila]